MVEELPRSRAARAAAERALVRLVRQYGELPEFVLLGGLVPELLCSGAQVQHAGTTDVDVQADLEIAEGAINAAASSGPCSRPDSGRTPSESGGGNPGHPMCVRS